MSDSSLRDLYCLDPYKYHRFPTREVKVGKIAIGGQNPIRIQSMTTTDTMDTEGSVAQSARMIDAGCELVRLTAPSKNEAENLRNIRESLRKLGYDAPLVADIHFTPNAAEIAAKIVEKVRVNPGNYADKKKFEVIEYTEESYQAELERIEAKFTPLVLLCKEQGTAMRIGTNHGSLSDRILSRYGDTPEGMVESAMEFIRICRKHDFHELVISMKASNTLVMVQAYRLLVATMRRENMNYPLHLGVTEAGDGEDGRVKSAVGIGALLEDGLGDTIRVSLTEAPEMEIPVAQKLAAPFQPDAKRKVFPLDPEPLNFNPFQFERLFSQKTNNIGENQVPVVVSDLSDRDTISPANLFSAGYNYSRELDKWNIQDLASDYIYVGANTVDFEIPGTLGIIADFENYEANFKGRKQCYPLVSDLRDLSKIAPEQICFIRADESFDPAILKGHRHAVLVFSTDYDNKTQIFRSLIARMRRAGYENAFLLQYGSTEADFESVQLEASRVLGSLLVDGMGDGIWIRSKAHSLSQLTSLSFGILQATRLRISRTEYISCPSCGRTLFDLQETTAKIRKETAHLKGIKIGIMGCIVNGPGEMADADYGYVGTGPGKINLYKEKTVVRKNVNESEAVHELIELIKEYGDWVAPKEA